MKEAIKTVVLVALIGLSIYQSWALAYRVPAFDTVSPTNYLKPEKLGDDKHIRELFGPKRIVLHQGDGSHAVVLPTTTYYQMVTKTMMKETFTVLREVEASSVEWEKIYDQQASIELYFADEVALSILAKWTTVERAPTDATAVNRIWLYYNEMQQQVQALFVSDRLNRVWRADTSFSFDDLKRYEVVGKYLPSYTFVETQLNYARIPRGYYVPDEPTRLARYRLFYQPVTGEQMKSMLFLDPSIIRQIEERDGSLIYTDGNLALQIRPNKRWMTYNAPVPPSEKGVEESEGNRFLTVIQFVNQHGGWNGQYMVERLPQYGTDTQAYVFRQYYGPYPIYESGTNDTSLLEVQMVNGIVSSYSRAMMTMDKVIEKQMGSTQDKAVLFSTLDSLGIAPEDIQDIQLAYQSKVSNEYIDLIPVWIIDTYTANPLVIPAMSR